MASELQQQVQRHREKHLIAQPIHKGRPSLFLSAKEAAAVDVSDIYDTAIRGLRTLAQYEHRFQPYFHSLFLDSSKDLQRELKTASENDGLDRELSRFLQLLSPYSTEHSAHTVLEFLIRRYRINELNVNSLILCVIPFHDTKIFAKVIELSTISGTMWSFLDGVKQSGSPIPRAMLIKYARKNPSLLAALTGVATSALRTGKEAHAPNPLLNTGVDRIVSFYTATMVEMCDNKSLDDAQLRVLFPYLVGGIKGEDLQWCRSGCILLSQLSRSTRLASPFVSGIISAMFTKIALDYTQISFAGEDCIVSNVIKCFAVFTQLQKVVLDKKILSILFADGMTVFLSFTDAISSLSTSFDVESVYESLFCGLVNCLIDSEGEGGSNGADAVWAERCQGGVNHFLCSGVLSHRLVAICIDLVMDHALKLMKISGSKKKTHKLVYMGPIIQILLQRYSEEFNTAIKDLQKSEEGEQGSEQLRKNLWQLLRSAAELEDTLYSRGASENGTSLLLSLSHPSSEVRAAAIDTFDEVVTDAMTSESPVSPDVTGLVEAVLMNLAGKDESVCSRGWNDSIVRKVASVSSPASMAACVASSFTYWLDLALRKPKKDGRNVFNLILSCLRQNDFIKALGQEPVPIDNTDSGAVSDKIPFEIWLSANLLYVCSLEEDTALRLVGVDEEKAKKLVDRYSTIQEDALLSLQALGEHVDIFNVKVSKSKAVSPDGFMTKIAAKITTQVVDRDPSIESSISLLAAVAKATVSQFSSLNNDYYPEIQKRNYVSLLSLLKSICSSVAECESDPFQMPSVRSYFLCLQEIFSSVLAAILPVELSVDYTSAYSLHLLELYGDYLSNDFSLVLQTGITEKDYNKEAMVAYAAADLKMISADSSLLLFLLSASTKHAEVARLLGPLLMSGLVTKQNGSAFDIAQLLMEAIIAPSFGGNASAVDSAHFRLKRGCPIYYCDPAANASRAPLICPSIFEVIPEDGETLVISAEAKIAACQALCSILPIIDLGTSNGMAQMARSVAVLCPLVVQLFSEQHAEFRKAGLFICKSLHDIFKAQKSSLKFDIKFLGVDTSIETVSFTAGTLVQFGNTFLNTEELIIQDPARVTQVLSDNVFSEKSSLLESLKKLLLSSALSFGWSRPFITSAVLRSLLMSCSNLVGLPESAWPFVKALLLGVAHGHDQSTSEEVFLSEVILRCLKHTSTDSTTKNKANYESDVVEAVLKVIESSASDGFVMYAAVLQWLSLTGPDSGSEWMSVMNQQSRIALFRALLSKSLRSPGSPDIIAALALIPVDVEIVIEELVAHKKAILKAVKSGDFGEINESMEVISYSNVGVSAGDVSSTVQLFYNALDAVSPLIRKLVESSFSDINGNTAPFGNIVCIMFDILEVCVDPRLSSVLVIEYCKGVILDTIKDILCAFSSHPDVHGTSSVKSSKRSHQRSGSTNSVDGDVLAGSYPLSRINADTDCLFKVLQTSKLHHTQGSVLAVLNSFMQISPNIVSSHAISTLSEILSGTTLHSGSTQRESGSSALSVSTDSTASLLRSVLITLTKFIDVSSSSKSLESSNSSWDLVIQPLFAHFQSMTQLRRVALVKTAVDVLGEGCMSSCASTLLIHSFASFFNNENSSVKTNYAMDIEGEEDKKQQSFTAVISRNAGRKANRQVVVSHSQEMYQLALDTFLSCKNPVIQTSTLVMLISTATELFEYGLQSGSNKGKNDKLECISGLLEDSLGANPVSDPIKLAVLHLQFIYSILENGKFHRVLAPHINGWDLTDIVLNNSFDASKAPQEYFVLLCETAMKFLASSVNAQQLETRDNVSYGTVSMATLSKEAWSYCVSIIESLQRLLDGPTFLAVLQELLSHDQPAVRQKALQILASRLQQLSNERDDVESSLYVGLIQRIKDSVEAAVDIFSDKKAIKDDKRMKASHIISLAQSGIMCIELLAGHVNQDKESAWHPMLEKCLEVELVLIEKITESTIGDGKTVSLVVDASDGMYAELVRLLGSTCLCCVTICATIGAKVLPKLKGLLQVIIMNMKSHSSALLLEAGGKNAASDAKKKKQKTVQAAAGGNVYTNRSRVLMLRSAVSAIAALASAMPNFMHPYIEECILTSLSICQIKFGGSGISIEGSVDESGTMLDKDVYRSMVVMVASIPPRLSIPKLLETSQTLTRMIQEDKSNGSSGQLVVMIRFVELLADHWNILDRVAVANNISQIGPLMIEIMGFRFNSMVQSDLTRSLDARVADACIQLCMKLTEAEVRAFLVHAVEWVNASLTDSEEESEDEDTDSAKSLHWLKFAKSVSFFHCVSALNEKLKGVFTATMGCLWDVASDTLATINRTLKSSALTLSKADDKKSSSKKRKEIDEEEQIENSRSIRELILLSTDILTSVRRCCLYDKSGFIDEERYDMVVLNVVALLASRKWFEEEDSYEAFCVDTVIPCFTALAIGVGKDTLWKPLNHAILMLSRDKKRIVRVVCVKALHKLFTDVGEEYLILLPECLPFLSELMEDTHPVVTAATSELVRYIEEISGESLDTYLH